jgi:hypothetical protein
MRKSQLRRDAYRPRFVGLLLSFINSMTRYMERDGRLFFNRQAARR